MSCCPSSVDQLNLEAWSKATRMLRHMPAFLVSSPGCRPLKPAAPAPRAASDPPRPHPNRNPNCSWCHWTSLASLSRLLNGIRRFTTPLRQLLRLRPTDIVNAIVCWIGPFCDSVRSCHCTVLVITIADLSLLLAKHLKISSTQLCIYISISIGISMLFVFDGLHDGVNKGGAGT